MEREGGKERHGEVIFWTALRLRKSVRLQSAPLLCVDDCRVPQQKEVFAAPSVIGRSLLRSCASGRRPLALGMVYDVRIHRIPGKHFFPFA